MPTTAEHKANLDLATYYASRSSIRTFKTGAVLFDKYNNRLSGGWSHYSQLKLTNYRSIHAEMNALIRCGYKRNYEVLRGGTIYIATIRVKSGNIGLAYPCEHCMALLYEVGIRNIFYTVDHDDYDMEILA